MKKDESAGATPRRHDAAFKVEAVRLWKDSGDAAEKVARELGVSVFELYRWRKEQVRNPPPPGVVAPARTMVALQAENDRLRQEVARLTEQREILKKAAGILSEPPRNGMP
jgi:transposase